MIFDWKGKVSARPWVRTLSQGWTQIFTRVLGTTVVLPSSPRQFALIASQSTAVSLVGSRGTAIALVASET